MQGIWRRIAVGDKLFTFVPPATSMIATAAITVVRVDVNRDRVGHARLDASNVVESNAEWRVPTSICTRKRTQKKLRKSRRVVMSMCAFALSPITRIAGSERAQCEATYPHTWLAESTPLTHTVVFRNEPVKSSQYLSVSDEQNRAVRT